MTEDVNCRYQAQVNILKEALSFYTNVDHYRSRPCCSDVYCNDSKTPVLSDKGKRARLALYKVADMNKDDCEGCPGCHLF